MRVALSTTGATALVMTLLGFACSTQTSSGFGAASGASGSSGGGGEEDGGGSISLGGSSGSGIALPGQSSGSSGGSAGPIGCDPTCAAAGGTCTGSTCTIAENLGGVAAATQTTLHGSGTADTAFAWLYPYNHTVFPRGLVSPTMQFGGGASDAEYVHMTSTNVDYKGYFKGGAQGAVQLALSQKAWDAVLAAVGATDTLTIAVTKVSGSSVTGPISESWNIAQGSVRGTIYYETYDSTIIAGVDGGLGGILAEATGIGIMKIQPGATQPTPLKSGCGNVCHSASADGSTLVSATTLSTSIAYDLKTNASTISSQSNDHFTYGGLYPDGTFLMSDTKFRDTSNTSSQLFDTMTGANIAAPGWDGVITSGGTTAFSPDGLQIAFVHEDEDNGHTLAKMNFTVGTKTFSGLTDLATDPNDYIGWPAFTPDGKSIVYHSGSNSAFETDEGATGNVFIVDIATKTVHRLDSLDGYTGTGTGTYLPAQDPDMNFAPTVLPEAVGGYFWTVFTSHRSYGNLAVSQAGADQDGKLWVAALDIGAPPGQDTSHPAFYLDGQELTADNLRGFWVLPPCEQTGSSCSSGDQCCTGFCRSSGSGTSNSTLVCVTKPQGCSNEYESCTTAANCCTAGDQCINGRCALPAVPQ
jgi:hypothetical protein